MHTNGGQVPETRTSVKTQISHLFAKIILRKTEVNRSKDGGVSEKVLKQHPGRYLKLPEDFRHHCQHRVQLLKLITYDDS